MRSWLLIMLSLSCYVDGFTENICFNDGSAVPCLGQNPECPVDDDSPKCRAYALQWNAGIQNSNPQGRSMVHVDNTYYIALALGYSAEFAYFVAASVEVVDLTQYQPVDKCGNLLEDKRYITTRINGFQRQHYCVGGLFYHWPFPSIKGVETDPVWKEQLLAIRKWGMGETDQLCVGGWTEPQGGSYFGGDKCYCNGTNHDQCPFLLAFSTFASIDPPGPITGQGFKYYALGGSQIIYYDDDDGNCVSQQNLTTGLLDDCSCVKNPVYVEDFDEYVENEAKTQGIFQLEDGTVPVAAARLAVWIHSMQDSYSHDDCIAASTFATAPDANGIMQNAQDQQNCAQPNHALGHYWETGWNVVPSHVRLAIEQTYVELNDFKQKNIDKHPEWFVSKDPLLTQDQATSDSISALKLSNVQDSLDAFVALEVSRGWEPMPGLSPDYRCQNSSPSPASPSSSASSISSASTVENPSPSATLTSASVSQSISTIFLSTGNESSQASTCFANLFVLLSLLLSINMGV